MSEADQTPDANADDPRAPLDVRIDSPGREGLTGTAPANLYRRLRDAEEITLAPDGRPMAEQPAWRTDFPIDWPQDEYVERRDFMKFMVLTSLAFTAGQFWIALQNWLRRRRGRPEIRREQSIFPVVHRNVSGIMASGIRALTACFRFTSISRADNGAGVRWFKAF